MKKVERKTDRGESNNLFTRETLGVVLILFATVCLICVITREKLFYEPGKAVNAFFLGCFGYFAYAVLAFIAIIGVCLVVDKKPSIGKKNGFFVTAFFSCVALIWHIASMSGSELSYGEYIAAAYNAAEGGIASASAGGFFTAVVAYPFKALLSEVGSYVVISLLLAVDVYFFAKNRISGKKPVVENTFNSSYVKNDLEAQAPASVFVEGEKDYPVADVVSPAAEKPSQKLFVTNADDFALRSKKEIAKGNGAQIKLGFGKNGLAMGDYDTSYKQAYNEDLQKKIEYIKTPTVIDVASERQTGFSRNVDETEGKTTVSGYVNRHEERQKTSAAEIPFYEHNGQGNSASVRAEEFSRKYAETEEGVGGLSEEPEEIVRPAPEISEQPRVDTSTSECRLGRIIPENIIEAKEPDPTQEPDATPAPRREENALFGEKEPTLRESRTRSALFGLQEEKKLPNKEDGFISRVRADDNLSSSVGGGFTRGAEPSAKSAPTEKQEKPKAPINRQYFRPPFDLLESHAAPADAPQENHEARMAVIKQTLEDFHINAEPQSYVQGPSITRYEVTMPAGISVKKVLAYDDDLKMRLESKAGVRIEAPIPGKNLIGIEVANKVKVTVGLREIMEKSASKPSKPGALTFAIGKDIVGNAITDNLAKGPHYLVAGATGSGKSVCLNVMIISLIMRYSPEELRLVLVDPKGVEFKPYEHIPHLMIDEIITEPKKSLAVLQWACEEMERRYKTFQECDCMVLDINVYNEKVASDTVPKMPRIVIVIDELSNLMETCKREMEAKILALAQKSRAVGIHLVLATQRPSVDVITGTIKANLPSRIALKVMNFADSNTILSEGGAEKLLGNGDMLYKNASMSECERYQGAWITDREITNVVSYIKEHNAAYFDDDMQEYLDNAVSPKTEETSASSEGDGGGDEIDELFLKALWLAITSGTASISQFQRRFQIGYARAGRLVDVMERMGYISANEGSKARRVLITREEYESNFGQPPEA